MTTLPDELPGTPDDVPDGSAAVLADPAVDPAADSAADPAAGPVEDRPTLKSLRLRRLLFGMTLTNLLLCVLWSAIASAVLAIQVRQIDPTGYVASLSLILAVGSIGSMISGPIAGTLSDRFRSRLGGRVPLNIVGAAATLVLALLMGGSTSITALVVYYFLLQFFTVGFVSTVMYANLPDRVPVARRGVFSASLGVAALVGATVGQAVGALFAKQIFVGYLVVGCALVVGVLVLAAVGSRSNVGEPKPPLNLGAVLRTFWVNPVKYPDFAWTFVARFMLYSGYYLISSYQLYLLQDYAGLGQERAIQVLPIAGVASLVGVLVSTPLAGFLVDRLGRTRPLLIIVAVVLGVGSLIPLVAPTAGGIIAYAATAGFGFGAYLSVDFVLVTQVLPSSADAGKDLGIINITATLPHTVASGIAGLVITLFGTYTALFPIAAVLAFLGGFLLLPVKGVR